MYRLLPLLLLMLSQAAFSTESVHINKILGEWTVSYTGSASATHYIKVINSDVSELLGHAGDAKVSTTSPDDAGKNMICSYHETEFAPYSYWCVSFTSGEPMLNYWFNLVDSETGLSGIFYSGSSVVGVNDVKNPLTLTGSKGFPAPTPVATPTPTPEPTPSPTTDPEPSIDEVDVIPTSELDSVIIDSNLNIRIPTGIFQSSNGESNIWVELDYDGTNENGEHIWKLKNYGSNQ